MDRGGRVAWLIVSVCAAALGTSIQAVHAQEAQEEPEHRETSRQRQGPSIQAEAQDVPGGIEAEPSEFDASGHLLGDFFGTRTALAHHGIAINPVFTFDYIKNLRGGIDTAGASYIHQMDLAFTVQTEPLIGLKGGTFFADMFTEKGQSPEDEVGDFAQVDEIDFGGRTQVNEIWYEQKLFNNAVRVKLGKIDTNTEFCFATHSLDFSNGGLNHTFPNSQFEFMPTAADPAWGMLVFVYPNDTFYIGGGVFDGSLVEGFNGDYGPST